MDGRERQISDSLNHASEGVVGYSGRVKEGGVMAVMMYSRLISSDVMADPDRDFMPLATEIL